MNKNHYQEIQGALLRVCSTLAQKLVAAGAGPTVHFNMDGFTDEGAWPLENFVALGEFTLTLDDFYEGTAVIALGLKEDSHLLRSAEYLSIMLDDLLPNSSLPVLNMITGEPIGQLFIMARVKVGAPLLTKTRPLLPIMFGFSSNLQTS